MHAGSTVAPAGGTYSAFVQKSRCRIRRVACSCLAAAIKQVGVVDPSDQRKTNMDSRRRGVRDRQSAPLSKGWQADIINTAKPADCLSASPASAKAPQSFGAMAE